MRKLMWFTIGFAAACAAGAYVLDGVWIWMAGLFCLLGCVVSWAVHTKKTRMAAAILLGGMVGFVWFGGFNAYYLSIPRNFDGQTISATITASDYSYDYRNSRVFDGKLELEGKTYPVRCYSSDDRPVGPGDTLTGEFRLRYTARGGIQEETHHPGKGIYLLLYQRDEAIIQPLEELTWREYPAMWRQRIRKLIEEALPQDTVAFAKALLLGDSSELPYEVDRAFQVSGIRHVIAVSGLHVSILFAIIYMFFGRNRVLNALFGVPLLAVFAAIAGFTPSIVRACLMQVLMLLAQLTDKEYDPPSALAFAALVILGINPMAITSVSFQLSVSCMIGIFAFSEPLKGYILRFGKWKQQSKGKSRKAKAIRWIVGCISITLSAMVTTTPLCAFYFGMVSIIGILTNLLTLWVVSFIFYGIMISCLVSCVWLPLGKGIGWCIAWPVRYVLTLSGTLAKFPLAAVYTDSVYITVWLIFSYVLLLAYFLLKKKYKGILASGIAVGLCVCLSLSWLEPRLDHTRMSVIAVGQGQCILLQQGKEQYLVDCGSDSPDWAADTAANFLLSQGIFHLDGVILTHYDADHAGGILQLLSSVTAERIYMPDTVDSNGLRYVIENSYPDKITLLKDKTTLKLDGGIITLLPAESADSDNESSVCVLFQAEKCDILITGDRSAKGERQLLEQMELPQLELLVVGHHGSNESTSHDLLQATIPQLAVISVSADNPYGHPRQEVLDRLAQYGCQIHRTDLEGTIIFRR